VGVRVPLGPNSLVKGVGGVFLVTRHGSKSWGFWNLKPCVDEILVCVGVVLDEFVCRMMS
jgi:hypothetical protein